MAASYSRLHRTRSYRADAVRPITTYPEAIQWVVRCSLLYHAIELLRALNLGIVGGAAQLVNVAYLLVLGAFGLFIAQRRLGKLLLK
jgi:lipooligosaccharide transport system permease protein